MSLTKKDLERLSGKVKSIDIPKEPKTSTVQHVCRCIVASKYLKKYLQTFEDFKNQIENLKTKYETTN